MFVRAWLPLLGRVSLPLLLALTVASCQSTSPAEQTSTVTPARVHQSAEDDGLTEDQRVRKEYMEIRIGELKRKAKVKQSYKDYRGASKALEKAAALEKQMEALATGE